MASVHVGGDGAAARIIRGIGANTVAQLTIVVAQITLVPVMAVNWGGERYGLWLVIFTVPACLALGDFGFGTAAATRMTMEVARGDRKAGVTTFQNAFAVIGGLSILLTLVGCCAVLALPASMLASSAASSDELRYALLGAFCYGTASLFSSLPAAGFRCSGRYALGTLLAAFTLLAETLVAVGLVAGGVGLAPVAIGYLLTRLACLILQMVVLRRVVPWLTPGVRHVSLSKLHQLVVPAAAVLALPAAQALMLQGSTVAVGAAVSTAAVAGFTAVRPLVRTCVQATTVINHAIMPELSAAASRGETAVVRRIIRTTVATSILVLVPGAVILLAIGPQIVDFWTGGAIHADYMLIVVMTAMMVINGVWHPLSNLLLAVNRQASYSYVRICGRLRRGLSARDLIRHARHRRVGTRPRPLHASARCSEPVAQPVTPRIRPNL